MDIEGICNNFFSDNKNLSSSVLLSYQKQNNVKNINNPIQLKNFILNSQEFSKHFTNVFENAFKRVYGDDVEKHKPEMMKKFMSQYMRSKDLFNIFEVMNFLKNDILFVNYYKDRVENIYKFFYSDTIGEKELIETIEFIKCLDFGKDDIDKKLKAFIYSYKDGKTMADENVDVVLEEHKQYFIDLYQTKFSKSPDSESIKQFNDFLNQKMKQVELYFHNKYNDCTVFYTDIVKIFEDVFHRDITVFEYVKYYSLFGDDTYKNIREYHTNFTRKFKIVLNIYNTYLNSKLDYISFIHIFLGLLELDDDLFLTKTIDIVIDYTEYLNVMFEKVKTIYKNTYNTTISDLDLQYFFEKIYDKKLNLIDDELPKLITTLKDETDEYESTISNIFNKILNRNTEDNEMNSYIMYYRYSHESNIQPSVRLEDELYESLEYHDILKDIIADKYVDVSKSELYKMLNVVLKCDDPLVKRDKTSVHNYLEATFKH